MLNIILAFDERLQLIIILNVTLNYGPQGVVYLDFLARLSLVCNVLLPNIVAPLSETVLYSPAANAFYY